MSLVEARRLAGDEEGSGGVQDYGFPARTTFLSGQKVFDYSGVGFSITPGEVGKVRRLRP